MENSPLTDDDLRDFANILLTGMANMCRLLPQENVGTYLDYVVEGAIAFREGFRDDVD